jgi:hypothetical protein
MTKFETEEDLAKELEVMKRIAKKKGWEKFYKQDPNDVDFLVPGITYIEIKCYNFDSKKLHFFWVSMIKLYKLQQRAKKLPTYLFIQYNDKLVFIKFEDIHGFIAVRKKGTSRID